MKYSNHIDRAIQDLATMLDEETRSGLPTKYPLVLLGDMANSPFLRAVRRKAQDLGVDVYANRWPKTGIYRVVADKETAAPFGHITQWEDIDRLMNDGFSSTAWAVWLLLNALDLVRGKDIAIVGRGHSVKGLAEWLTDNDATVTVAHSETESLLHATKGKDVVIYATPELDKVIAYDTESLVIDLGGAVEHPSWFNCQYLKGTGPLTVSVLLNRFSGGGC
jgi:hypothetical protein